jgi:ABC-type sugar transport system, permease component
MQLTRKKTGLTASSGASDAIYHLLTTLFMLFCGLMVFIPLLYVVSASFSSPAAIGNGRVYLLPVDPGFQGYTAVITSPRVWLGFRNSVLYTVLGTFINVVMTMLTAYPLSRPDFRARGVVMKLFTFTMLFSGGMIPHYLLVNRLGMVNTIWAMVIPGAISVYNMIVARTYIMQSIPMELFESAALDGCTDDRYLVSIVVPLSKPIIAVLVLWYAVGHWNAYFNAMIYLRDKNLSPLQIVLREFLIVEDMSEANIAENIEEYMNKLYMKNLYQYSLIVVSAVPVMLLYPFIQKYFVKGIMLGSIKG